jgi:hypothetical protein
MEKTQKWSVSLLVVVLVLWLSGCGGGGGDPSNPSDIAVTFNSVTANGSATQTTPQLTLNFSQAIPGLSADDITVGGVSSVVKGTLSGSGPSYTLPISGFSSGGTLSVAVAKSGYAISGSSKTVNVFFYSSGNPGDIEVWFNDLSANGSATQTTTQLSFEFNDVIQGLTADDITLSGVSGVVKGILSGSGPTYILPISGFSTGGTLSVAVAKSGYAISGSTKTVTVYYSSGNGSGDTAVTFSNVTAHGSSSQTTTQLTLTFSQAIAGLSADDITLNGVSGVSKGTLSGSGPTYTLPISGFISGGTLSVVVAKFGYAVSGSPQTVTIYYNSSGDGSETNPFLLIENEWADGEFLSRNDVQWFKLTATAATQYIHVSFGTLSGFWGVDVKVYDSNGNDVSNEVGSSGYFSTTDLYDTWSLSLDDDYFIKASSDSTTGGTYRIGFTKTIMVPGTRTTLTLNELSDGNIATSTGEQWFKFTATASTHYIHFLPNTLTMASVVLYHSDGTNLGGVLMTSGDTYMSKTTTVGQEYHIYVKPYSNYSGSYKIGFNTSSTAPGISWTPIAANNFAYFNPRVIAYGNGRFVGVGGTTAAYSINGITWTETSIGLVSSTFRDMAYGYYRFVAVGDSGRMVESGNGTSWSYITNTTFGSTNINGIIYGASTGKFVAVGNEGKAAYATDSPAMGDWTASYINFGTTNVNAVSFGNGKFVAVGAEGKAAYSSDGINWTTVSDTKFGTSDIYRITYGGGNFVAVGQSGKAAYSNDGITWTAVDDIKFGTLNINDVAYGGGNYVAVGQSGKAAYSSDSITWNVVDNTTFNNDTIFSITYGGGKFIAATDSRMAYWITP